MHFAKKFLSSSNHAPPSSQISPNHEWQTKLLKRPIGAGGEARALMVELINNGSGSLENTVARVEETHSVGTKK